MIPPFLRRCPECGHVTLGNRFARVDSETVECPSCGHQYEPIDSPILQ